MKKLFWIITIIGSTFFIFTDPVGFTPFLVLSIFFYLIFHHSSDNKDRGKHETPSTIVDPLDKQYSLLFQIVDKKWMLNVIRMGNDAKVLYEDNEKKFQEFGKRIGKEIVRRFGASGIAPEEQKVEGKEPFRTPDLPGVERQRGK